MKTFNYTDGSTNIRLSEQETPPEGFHRGQTRRPYTELERKESVAKRQETCLNRYGNSKYNAPDKCVEKRRLNNTLNTGKHFYTDGKTNTLCFEKDAPEGFIRGKIEKSKPSMRWYTNSINSILINEKTTTPPKGYFRGRVIEKLSYDRQQLANQRREQTNLKIYGFRNQFCDVNKIQQAISASAGTSHSNGIDSLPNVWFAQKLKDNNISYEREFSVHGKRYDFKVGNTLIEINPFPYHNITWTPIGTCISEDYHFVKTNIAINEGYNCISIFDWDDTNKIIALLKDRKKCYARQCKIKEVSSEESKVFLDTNHLQGSINSKVQIGLYYDDNLVLLMTLGKPRYNKNYDWELLRYCSTYNVTGGAERVLKHFISEYHPKSIISYCDKSKFSGAIYDRLGFELKSCSYSKHWYHPEKNIHITDNLLRQRGFDQLFNTNYGKGTSNNDLMLQYGFVEICDCGQATYVKIIN